ncbi:MAG: hypothetical protein V3T98_02170 [Candidatus Paceibacterota bacterium]
MTTGIRDDAKTDIINSLFIKKGVRVPSGTKEQKIVVWKTSNTKYTNKLFTKVYIQEFNEPKGAVAVSNPIYRGPGLIVFVDRKPLLGEEILITELKSNCAIGTIIAKS